MNNPGFNYHEALKMLQSNPKEFMQRAGVNVPDEILNNPQAIVMHLIQTGQVKGPMSQRIMPMINMMNSGR